MSHTKGNWYSKGIHIMIEGKTGSQGQAFLQTVPSYENNFAKDKEAEANARLMAASPDMLDALVALKDYCKYHDIRLGSGIVHQIETAISKAVNS